MISGRFGDIGELLFEINLIAGDGEFFPVEVLLDTGFTTGWLAIDVQDARSLGWSVIELDRLMQTAQGAKYFDIYEGRVILDGEQYIIPVLAAMGIPESLLGLQWLKILSLAVNFSSGILTLG
jgi:predicted aspartyl protease